MTISDIVINKAREILNARYVQWDTNFTSIPATLTRSNKNIWLCYVFAFNGFGMEWLVKCDKVLITGKGKTKLEAFTNLCSNINDAFPLWKAYEERMKLW